MQNAIELGTVAQWASSFMTLVAVGVALWTAAQNRRDRNASNQVRAATYAGQVAIELHNTCLRLVAILGVDGHAQRFTPKEKDELVMAEVGKIRIVALKTAGENADVFDADTAKSIGTLIGLVRAMRTYKAEIEHGRGHVAGEVSQHTALLAVDAATRVIHLSKEMWRLSGMKGETPIPAAFEKLRTLLARQGKTQ